MLVISRKQGESILIGDDIEIKVSKIEDGNVKMAISAPKEMTILRNEVLEKVKEENKQAIGSDIDLLKLLKK